MWWLAALGCHRLGKVELSAEIDPCGEIRAPLAGFSAEAPVPADPDAPDLGGDPMPRQIRLSWAGDPATTQAIVWRTDEGTRATRVQYRAADGEQTGGELADALERTGGSFLADLTDAAEGRLHEIRLCDLQPDTTYRYRVGGGPPGQEVWSEEHAFITAPPPGEERSFTFGVAGDSRDNQATWGELVAQMEAYDPAFYLFSGDMVDLGVNMEEWDAWFDAFAGVGESRSVMPVHGNHEFLARQYFAFFSLPGNEQWYSFDYAQLHVAGLNDTVAQATDIDAQAVWLDQDLSGTERPLKVVFHHMPAYTSCTTHPPDARLQEKWSPVEETHGVAIDFTGHNHNYERSVPLRGGQETTADLGTTYVVSAGAGADLYDNDLAEPYTLVAQVAWHYLIVEVEGRTLTTTAYDLAGNVLDRFSVSR